MTKHDSTQVDGETLSPIKALPGPWYISEDMFKLEKRAIFSKRWQLITHKSRLSQPGNWLKYEIAGFHVLLVRDRQGNINAFHNICRHRAYKVVEGDSGTNRIFACKYHGWSYGINGKLAKAPGYGDLPSFSKDENGLFPIHTHIDNAGFIWINLDAKKEPEHAWDDDFTGGDTQKRYENFDFNDYDYVYSWGFDADYNWKLAVDNFNECYHCKTAHPDVPSIVDIKHHTSDTQRCWIAHNGSMDRKFTPEEVNKGLLVCASYFWPNASVNVSKHLMFTQRFVPIGVKKTKIVYEVYRNRSSSDEQFKPIDEMYHRVMTEDKGLCAAAQKNIDTGVFINGEMHPFKEKGSLFCQTLTRSGVMSHREKEIAQKAEIWPAKLAPPSPTSGTQKDIDFCASLGDCSVPRDIEDIF